MGGPMSQGGLGSMRAMQPPSFGTPQFQIFPGGLPPATNPGEVVLVEKQAAPAPFASLIASFREELKLSDDKTLKKRQAWNRVQEWVNGEDPDKPEEDYDASTFVYRRLPRIIQSAKEKVMKHVRTLHGRAWEIDASAQTQKKKSPEEQQVALAVARRTIEDVFQASCVYSDLLDEAGDLQALRGTAVILGPMASSESRMILENGREIDDPDTEHYPMWMVYDPMDVFPDPDAKRAAKMEFIYFRHKYSTHQLRMLLNDDSFNHKEIQDLLLEMANGNWNEEKLEFEDNAEGVRYCVWLRVGFLDSEAIKVLDKEKGLSDRASDEEKVSQEGLYFTWFCGNRVIKASRRVFRPKVMPTMFIPFRKDAMSPFGIGPGEAALEIQEMLTNICRAIEDDLSDSAGFQATINTGVVKNTDLGVRGRKTWTYRYSESNPQGSGKPVDFFNVPSNMEMLLRAFGIFESMIPVVTGVPEAVTGKDLGSGIRTDDMYFSQFDVLEEFLKDTVGSWDRYFWAVAVRDTHLWLVERDPEYQQKAGFDLQIVANGLRGALRREIVGKKAEALMMKMQQFGMPDWIDDRGMAMAMIEGMGMDMERGVLDVEGFLLKQQVKMMQKMSEAAATAGAVEQVQGRERAHTSIRDVFAQAYKTTNPNEPLFVPIAEKLFELTGQTNERVWAALSIHAKALASYYQRLGLADPNEVNAIAAPFRAESQAEVEPGTDPNLTMQPRFGVVPGQPFGPNGDPAAAAPIPGPNATMAPITGGPEMGEGLPSGEEMSDTQLSDGGGMP